MCVCACVWHPVLRTVWLIAHPKHSSVGHSSKNAIAKSRKSVNARLSGFSVLCWLGYKTSSIALRRNESIRQMVWRKFLQSKQLDSSTVSKQLVAADCRQSDCRKSCCQAVGAGPGRLQLEEVGLLAAGSPWVWETSSKDLNEVKMLFMQILTG